MDKQNQKVDYLEGTHFHRAKKASIRYGNAPKPYYGRYFRSARSNRFTKNLKRITNYELRIKLEEDLNKKIKSKI